jgi:hypothetical protein
MRRPPLAKNSLSQVAGIAVVLLVLTLGVCGIHCPHSPGHDRDQGVMVCSGAPASFLFLVLIVGPMMTGYLSFDQFRSLYAVSLPLRDPPPKALSIG